MTVLFRHLKNKKNPTATEKKKKSNPPNSIGRPYCTVTTFLDVAVEIGGII